MIRAIEIRAGGDWTGDAADTIVLDFDDRHRRRLAMTGVRGLAFLLDLPEATALRGGDALVLEDGRLVEVVAAPEPLTEIRARDTHQMVRIGWHLGNRHLPTEIVGTRLRIRRDHVIEEMVRGLGAETRAIEAPFNPEGGAYAQPRAGQGAHAHHHPHAHAHHTHHHHGHGRHGHDHEPHGHHHNHHDHDDHHDHDGHDHHDHHHDHPPKR